jgi:hypothetical protein
MADFFDRMDTKTKIYCGTITSIVVLATAIVALSFGTIEPTEYAIAYNSISKNID